MSRQVAMICSFLVFAVFVSSGCSSSKPSASVTYRASDPALPLRSGDIVGFAGLGCRAHLDRTMQDTVSNNQDRFGDQAALGATPLVIYPPAMLRDMLDPEILAEVVADYGKKGRLRSEDVARIDPEVGAMKYMAVAQVLGGGKVTTSSTDVVMPNDNKNQGGAGVQEPTFVDKQSTSVTTSVRLDVFDLDSGRLVWSASIAIEDKDPSGSMTVQTTGGGQGRERSTPVTQSGLATSFGRNIGVAIESLFICLREDIGIPAPPNQG